jgi:hypothetical protein
MAYGNQLTAGKIVIDQDPQAGLRCRPTSSSRGQPVSLRTRSPTEATSPNRFAT